MAESDPRVLKTMKRRRESNDQDVLRQNSSGMKGPVAILWDIENCCIPNGVSPEEVAGNIRKSLHLRGITGAVTTFSAYGDFSSRPRSLREGCQRSGVNLIDVPNGRKDAADKAILADMFLFALDNTPPSTILLISSDADFASALNKLGQRGYAILVAVLNFKHTCAALWNAAKIVWEWPKMARNQGFGESPDQVLLKKRIKATTAELSVNDAFFGMPNRGHWNLQFQSWGQGKHLLLQSQKNSNSRNQNNRTEASNCGFPSEITIKRNPDFSMQPSKTKRGDCGMPSETTEPNPISSMNNITEASDCGFPSEITMERYPAFSMQPSKPAFSMLPGKTKRGDCPSETTELNRVSSMQHNNIQPGDCQISSESTGLYSSLSMHPSNIRPDDWELPSETEAESNSSSVIDPSKIGSVDFGLPSEITEPDSTSSIQPGNISPGTFGLPSETTERNQMSLFTESGGYGLFWFYSSSSQNNYSHELAI